MSQSSTTNALGQLTAPLASKWQSIRPWDPRLALAVREITSVSATFALSSLSAHTNLSAILDGDDDDGNDGEESAQAVYPQILADAQAKGLSVKVNGQPWRRVLARVDDEADEAVIIVYSLLPGKQYDIEFGIVPGEDRVKGQIVTEQSRAAKSADVDVDIPEIVLSTEPDLSRDTSPSPPSSSPPSTPGSPNHAPQSIEDYLSTLQRTLSHLHAEHDSLLSDLKTARRDVQKSQAGLRAEITTLKKTAQKHAAGDVRMRQKERALEEATKQASRGREEIDAAREALEADYTAYELEGESRHAQWESVHAAAEVERRKREEAEEAAAAEVASVKSDLAVVEARVEKLRARREKLDGGAGSDEEPGGVVGELSARLRELQHERKAIEDDPYGYVDAASLAPEPEPRPPRATTHQRNHTHPHHGPGGTFLPPLAHRGRRHAPFVPPQILQRAPGALAPSQLPRAIPPVQRPLPQLQQPQQQQPARIGRPLTTRRRSSPTAPASTEKSTLSSLAPPFEPAAARSRGPPWGQS